MFGIDTNPLHLLLHITAITCIWWIISVIRKREDPPSKTIKSAAFNGLMWAVMYVFIRRMLSPDTKDLSMYTDDGIYGGLSIYAVTLFKDLF